MPNYRYGAHDAAGKPLQGVIEADSLPDAQGRLERRGWRVDRVELAVLPKAKAAAPTPTRRRSWLPVAILFVLAVAALGWFDPFGWLASLR
jgi:type II secretory pathway component PulF